MLAKRLCRILASQLACFETSSSPPNRRRWVVMAHFKASIFRNAIVPSSNRACRLDSLRTTHDSLMHVFISVVPPPKYFRLSNTWPADFRTIKAPRSGNPKIYRGANVSVDPHGMHKTTYDWAGYANNIGLLDKGSALKVRFPPASQSSVASFDARQWLRWASSRTPTRLVWLLRW